MNLRNYFWGIEDKCLFPPHHQKYIETSNGRIIVMGGVDTGKTHFSYAIFESMSKKFKKTGFIDIDPGQSKIGLPGFQWCLAKEEENVKRLGRILGDITPRGFENISVENFKAFLEYFDKREIRDFVVDTCGFVSPPHGVSYKIKLAEILKPQKIFIFDSPESTSLISAFLRTEMAKNLIIIKPSKYVKKRTPDSREIHRKKFIKNFFLPEKFRTENIKRATELKIVAEGEIKKLTFEELTLMTESLPGTICALEDNSSFHTPALITGAEIKGEDYFIVLRVAENLKGSPSSIIFSTRLSSEL